MKNIKKQYKGFTLIELLIVIVIIGILGAICLPQYMRSGEKAKSREAIALIHDIVKAEQSYYFANDLYTESFTDLHLDLVDKLGRNVKSSSFETNNYSFKLDDQSIIAKRTNNNYILAANFETGIIMCQPSKHFICSEFAGLDENSCNKAQMAWSNTNNTCYENEKERCESLDMPWNSDSYNSYCGYENDAGKGKVIKEGGKCIGTKEDFYVSCGNMTVEKGGVCEAKAYATCTAVTLKPGATCISTAADSCSRNTNIGSKTICKASGYCGLWSSFTDGAICVGNGSTNCVGSSFTNGSICYANASNACGIYGGTQPSTFDETSCCCGSYCPDTAPTCESRGIQCDLEYMK